MVKDAKEITFENIMLNIDKSKFLTKEQIRQITKFMSNDSNKKLNDNNSASMNESEFLFKSFIHYYISQV